MAEPEDHVWLAARERGEDVSHVPAEIRAPYDQLGNLLQALPTVEPPAGWKQRALAKLDAAQAAPIDELARRRPLRAWIATAAVVAAAAIVLIVVQIQRPPARVALAEPTVQTELRRAGPSRGLGEAALGDTLIVRAVADQAIELRLYGDTGELLARCSDASGCTVARDGERRHYTLELVLRAPGDVRTMLFVTAGRDVPARDLDRDLQAAHDAGLAPRQVGDIHVE